MKKSLIILFLLLLPVIVPLMQRGYFPIHDDLQVVRQMEMENCIKDLQFPCRWVKDLGYGYGYPLFVYYPPFPYLLGELFRVTGFSFLGSIKMVGLVGFAAAALTMYLLAREIWSEKSGVLASALYLYAPYRAVNFYVRAAVNEFWASAFFPLILLFVYRIISKRKRWDILGLALSFAGLMTSHNQMLLIFIPVIVVWTTYWWIAKRNWKSIWALGIGSVWGFCLAAFYFIPILLEQKYAHLQTLVIGYFNYLAHFLDLKQIFLRINWGYGSSIYGPGDTMSFALGYAQWIVPMIVVVTLLVAAKLRKQWALVGTLLLLGMWSLFMTHSKSTPIWQIVKPLEFLQFPWRFLSVAIFIFSLLGGVLGLVVPRKILAIMLVAIVVTNANYFRPREWYPDMTDADKFTGKTWVLMTTNAIYDYLPIDAPLPPADPPKGDVVYLKGQGTVATIEKRSNVQEYVVNATSNATLEIQTYYFPGWQVFVDGVKQKIDPSRDPLLGRMQIDVSAGTHQVVARFSDTVDRKIGDTLSLVVWIVTIGIIGIWWKTQRKLAI